MCTIVMNLVVKKGSQYFKEFGGGQSIRPIQVYYEN